MLSSVACFSPRRRARGRHQHLHVPVEDALRAAQVGDLREPRLQRIECLRCLRTAQAYPRDGSFWPRLFVGDTAFVVRTMFAIYWIVLARRSHRLPPHRRDEQLMRTWLVTTRASRCSFSRSSWPRSRATRSRGTPSTTRSSQPTAARRRSRTAAISSRPTSRGTLLEHGSRVAADGAVRGRRSAISSNADPSSPRSSATWDRAMKEKIGPHAAWTRRCWRSSALSAPACTPTSVTIALFS